VVDERVMTRPSVELLRRPEQFLALRSEWTELLRESAADNLFLTWEWLHTWWAHLGRSRQLALVTIRSGDRLLAIAPLAQQAWRPAALQFMPQLELLGSGDVGSDYLDVIVRRGAEATVMSVISEELGRRGAVLHLPQLANGHSMAGRLASRLQHKGWQLRISRTDVCPYIPLVGHTFESYLSTLGSSHRYNFRRRLRQLQRGFRTEFARVATETERREALALLVALHNDRWRPRGGSTAFYAPELLAFHDELTRRMLECGWLRMFVLSLDGTPVSALYGFSYHGKFYFYQCGFDPAYARYSVGLVTMGLSIAAAIDDGAAEFDLLHGDERYKFLWARAAHPLTGLELYPPSLLGAISRTTGDVCRAARALGRRAFSHQTPNAHGEPDFVVPSSR
jgi:CelD/BcsL family acetyltransferase involved in cellulose biosynthesis